MSDHGSAARTTSSPTSPGPTRLVVLVDDAHLVPRVVGARPAAACDRAVVPAGRDGRRRSRSCRSRSPTSTPKRALNSSISRDERAAACTDAQRVVGVVGLRGLRRASSAVIGPTSAPPAQSSRRTSSQNVVPLNRSRNTNVRAARPSRS